MLRPVLFLVAFVGVMTAAFFGAAGQWDVPMAWACIGVYVGFMLAALFIIDPGLRRERMAPAPGGMDRNIRRVMLPFLLGFWIVAGLDVRWHGTERVPYLLQLLGLAGLAGSLGLALWAMRHNRFFSPVVRIQSERGHHLITTGPYRFIRHPGYLGSGGAALCAAVALGSWWALIPSVGSAVVIIRRTILEDRFLRTQLAGYTEYARAVRYRVLPGIW